VFWLQKQRIEAEDVGRKNKAHEHKNRAQERVSYAHKNKALQIQFWDEGNWFLARETTQRVRINKTETGLIAKPGQSSATKALKKFKQVGIWPSYWNRKEHGLHNFYVFPQRFHAILPNHDSVWTWNHQALQKS